MIEVLREKVVSGFGRTSAARDRPDESEKPHATRQRCVYNTPVRSPNIVLITIDTLRADRLGAYRYFRDTSPALDALAEESIVFERCIAPMATTYPSHLSLLTSTYPHETGAVANAGAGGAPFVPTPYLRSLAQLLSESAYQTAAFVSAAPLKSFSGIDAGFDVFDEPEPRTRPAEETNARVFEWLEARGEAPSFLWVHYFEPHSPYQPPDPLDKKFRPDDELRSYLTERDFQPIYRAGTLPVHVNSRYDGEGLGQHGEKEHGGVWDEHLHVPLVIRVPGVEAVRVGDLISIADIVPTLMGLVELPNEDVFLRQASGTDRLAEHAERPLVFSQEPSAPWRTRRGERKPSYALTGNDWKLIHNPDRKDLLFRLSEDPFELEDVSAEHSDVTVRLRKILLARIEQPKARRTALGATSEQEVDPAIVEQLRALGYVQ